MIPKLTEEFFKSMAGLAPFEDGAEFAVAVSGGSDSMALTLLLHDYVKKNGGRLTALTVDHGLRPESYAEAVSVGDKLTDRCIRHEILRWQGEKPSTGVQEKAREARYRLLFDFCREQGILHLFLAHTLNDQAETFLIRLRRGSGLDGLTAIKKEVLHRDLRVLRPLLEFSRDDLRGYLLAKGESWFDDPSNAKECYERVKMRNLLPKMAAAGIDAGTIAAAVAALQRAKSAIDDQVVDMMAKTAAFDPAGFIRLDFAALNRCPDEVVLRTIARILMTIGLREDVPRFDRLLNFRQNLAAGKKATFHGCCAIPSQGALIVAREPHALPPPVDFRDDGVWAGFSVSCRGFSGTLGALGRAGFSQLKKSVRKSYPDVVRQGLPALFKGGRVVFCPHLGFLLNKDMDIRIDLDVRFPLT